MIDWCVPKLVFYLNIMMKYCTVYMYTCTVHYCRHKISK